MLGEAGPGGEGESATGKDMEEEGKSVKRFIRKVMDKRRRWMDMGNGQ